MADVPPKDQEFYEAQVLAAQNGQEAARTQALAYKKTAEFYAAKAEEVEWNFKIMKWLFYTACLVIGILIAVIWNV
jgi:type IV secretory pathway component VirB8